MLAAIHDADAGQPPLSLLVACSCSSLKIYNNTTSTASQNPRPLRQEPQWRQEVPAIPNPPKDTQTPRKTQIKGARRKSTATQIHHLFKTTCFSSVMGFSTFLPTTRKHSEGRWAVQAASQSPPFINYLHRPLSLLRRLYRGFQSFSWRSSERATSC